MARTVVGLFDTFGNAESALREVERLGIPHSDVSIVANNADNEYTTWRDNYGSDYNMPAAGTGATTGAVAGGIGGILLGLGLLVIPGLGPLAAAGPLVAGLTGAGVGAAAGGLLGALVDIGIPHEEAGYYYEGVRRGGTLVTVQAADNQIQSVVDALNRNGAVDINQRAAYYQQTGYTGYNASAQPYSAAELQAERDRLRANNMLYTGPNMTYSNNTGYTPGTVAGAAENTAAHINRNVAASGVEGNIPGVQTGGHAVDGSGMPDTRGVMEKTADAITGDRIDDKTGRPV
jgi:hypothetical protein